MFTPFYFMSDFARIGGGVRSDANGWVPFVFCDLCDGSPVTPAMAEYEPLPSLDQAMLVAFTESHGMMMRYRALEEPIDIDIYAADDDDDDGGALVPVRV